MSLLGFHISALRISGNGKPDAVVNFSHGGNLVHGPSDRGKSLIFNSIDYVLGAKDPLDNPALEGYEYITLEIRTNTNTDYSLTRDLQAGPVFLNHGRLSGHGLISDAELLTVKSRTKKNRHLSDFLVGLAGFSPDQKILSKKASGQQSAISFRNLRGLFMVGEDEISDKESPVIIQRGFSDTVD